VRGPMPSALGSWFPVYRPKQDGPGTPGQVSRSEMLGFLSLGGVTKWPCPSQMVFVWQDPLMARKDPKYASLSRYAHEAQ